MSEPEPKVRRAVISWQEVRALGGGPEAGGPPRGFWRRVDLDGVFAFSLFMPILFGAAFGALTAAIFVGLVAVYATLRWKSLLSILGPRLFLLAPAALAVVSTAWSAAPEESLRQGLALTLTLSAALLLSAARSPGAVFRGVTLAYLLYLIVARAFGATMQGGMGDIGATAALVALGVAAMAMRERAFGWAAFGAVAAAFELSALAQARPAGAVFGFGVAVLVVALLMAAIKARVWLRALVTGAVVAGAAAAGVFARVIAQQMTAEGHGLIAANPNLVKLADGWAQARALIAEERFLGLGFYGLWPNARETAVKAAQAAEAAAQASGSAPPLTVHNSYIDILLQLGWVGLWIVGATLIVAILAFGLRFVRRPNLALAVWGGILAYELVRIQVDVIGYAPFSPSAVLLTAALAAAFSPELLPRPARREAKPALPPASVVQLREYRALRAEREAKKADPAFRHPDRPS